MEQITWRLGLMSISSSLRASSRPVVGTNVVAEPTVSSDEKNNIVRYRVAKYSHNVKDNGLRITGMGDDD